MAHHLPTGRRLARGETVESCGHVGAAHGVGAEPKLIEDLGGRPRHCGRRGPHRGGDGARVEAVERGGGRGELGWEGPQQRWRPADRRDPVKAREKWGSRREVHDRPPPTSHVIGGREPDRWGREAGRRERALDLSFLRPHFSVWGEAHDHLGRHAIGLVRDCYPVHRRPEASGQRRRIARDHAWPLGAEPLLDFLVVNNHGVYRNGTYWYCRGMDAPAPVELVAEWTIDQLAQHSGVPGRTVREYQTLGLVHPPRRSGRIGLYDASHLRRLALIARLQERGYSLAGIGDLLAAWRGGDALTDILGLEPDQLVHIDEPGAPATIDQLHRLLPQLVPDRLDDLISTGIVEACGPDRYCVPSPSLLQLAIEALAAGIEVDALLTLLGAIGSAADAVADSVLVALASAPATDPAAVEGLVGRGRGLLSHGLGRLTLHRLGRRVGVTNDDDASQIATRLSGTGPAGRAARS